MRSVLTVSCSFLLTGATAFVEPRLPSVCRSIEQTTPSPGIRKVIVYEFRDGNDGSVQWNTVPPDEGDDHLLAAGEAVLIKGGPGIAVPAGFPQAGPAVFLSAAQFIQRMGPIELNNDW